MQKSYLDVAKKAAVAAGEYLLSQFQSGKRPSPREKAANDFVTAADTTSEEIILSHLRAAFPDHAVMAEESGGAGDSPYLWIVDPLDGTKNFIHGFPYFAVAVALQVQGKLEVGVVFDPVRGNLYHARRGKGAYCNGRRLEVSQARGLAGTMVATGFPFRAKDHIDPYLACFKPLFLAVSGMRRAGSAALDLAYTAEGIFDGFFEFGLSSWDIAAGALLVTEAGGVVTDFSGRDNYLGTGNVVAGGPRVHPEILRLVQRYFVAHSQERLQASRPPRPSCS